jgi:hypothetical protein
MKLIFLDIDGVLNSKAHYDFRGTENGRIRRDELLSKYKGIVGIELVMLDFSLVKKLCSFVVNNGCKLVISSTWREGHEPSHFEILFRLCGAEVPDGTVVGCTPILDHIDNQKRGHEIDQWVKDNNYSGNYVVIDDCDGGQFLPHQNLVKTEYSTGITDENIRQLGICFQ